MVALKKCVECFCDLAHKTVDQLFKVSTLCLDDHQVQPEDLEIVGDLSGETCSQICVHMLVFGKNWKTRLTLDSKLRGKICHKVEASVRFSTRTSHEWPSSHIQLQIGFSRWESSNRLQTGLIPRRRFCRKSDGLNVNNKKSDDTSPHYDAHHICSKQFVSLFSDCDFLKPARANVPEDLSLHLQARHRSQFIAPRWLRGNWTTRMPTWTITQYLHQITKLEATQSLKNSISKTRNISPQRRLEHHQAPGDRKRVEQHQALGNRKPWEIRWKLARGKFTSRRTLIKNNTSGNSMIQHKSFKPQNQEEQEFYTMVLQSICAKFGEDLPQTFVIPSKLWFGASSQWLSMGFILPEQVSRVFVFFQKKKANGYDQKFSKTTGFNTVPAATSANNDRTHWCIQYAQVLQDWNTFRWARISLLCDPAAKLIRMKVHVFSDSTLWVSLESTSIQKIGKQYWRTCGTNMDLSGNNLAAREVRSFSTYYEVLYHSNQEACSGILEQQANSRIFWREEHLLVNIQRHWLEKGNTEICLHNATEVGAFASQDTGASGCPRQEIRGGTEIPTNLNEHWILSHCEWLTCSSVILPDITSDEAIIAWTVEERRKNLPFPRYTRKP